MSHRLHSSKHLGLPTAASSFCQELSEQTKVEVQFKHAGIPRKLPNEVSLCLFRVLQEALQNTVKHSGVRSIAVDLHGTADAIDLNVADLGRGFEERDAFTRHGLGLISMRERLQLLHGELSVKSKPGNWHHHPRSGSLENGRISRDGRVKRSALCNLFTRR